MTEITLLLLACGGQIKQLFLAGDTAQQCIAGSALYSTLVLCVLWHHDDTNLTNLSLHSHSEWTAGAEFRFEEVLGTPPFLSHHQSMPNGGSL